MGEEIQKRGNSLIGKEIGERVKFFAEIAGTLMIDAGFLSVWAMIYEVSSVIITWLTAGNKPLVLIILTYIFEFSPLIPIFVYVYLDISKIVRKIIDSLRKK